MNDYDKAERFAIKRLDPAGFLLWLLVGLDSDLVFARWLETQPAPFPGEPDRRCDTVAELVSRSGGQAPWACLVEPQGQAQADFLVRVLLYLLLLHQELRHGPHGQDRYPMMAGIVNLTEGTLPSSLSWVPPGRAEGVGLQGGVWVRNVYTEDAAATLAGVVAGTIARCLLPWIALMQGGEQEGIIQEWRRLVREETDRALQANYVGLALVFAEKRRRGEVWRRALEGFNVEESAIVNEWRGQGREEGVSAMRTALLDLLAARFAAPIAEEVRHAVEGQADLKQLLRWHTLALTTPSIDSFRSAMAAGNGSATG
jgi:hypothetical protein